MTRTFTEHSYNYIQGWLKNQYATNPEFKAKALANNRIQSEKARARRMVAITLLEIEASRFRSLQMFNDGNTGCL